VRLGLVLRQLLAVLLLPGLAAGVAPAWIRAVQRAGDSRWLDDTWLWWVARAGSLVVIAAGFTLAAWCVTLFVRVGQGTLAPWDPTRRLVAVGPYRYVRNPMIGGVALLLAGQTLWVGSWKLAVWLAAFVVINHVYFLLVEEPGLVARFGQSYREYAAHVPRWIPRRTPWGE
jgi:protein-S-isoprenylcysteine O-methyltransferase Ste14